MTATTALGEALDATLRERADEVAGLVAAARDRDGWLAVVASTQRLTNTLAAVQEHAVAEVARREQVWAEDGTLDESVHPLGRVALDAADLVAPALGCSHAQAQRRVEQAVRVAAGRTPVEVDDPRGRPAPTGLPALHRAMADGRLDGYRAGVVSHELENAPADVAEAVVAALEPSLHEPGPTLRRRCRRILARICPDLLRERAERARASTGLRRWAAEPGVDAWYGTFPSEAAAQAWTAIDRRAHELVTAGTCTSVEQARGRALVDLVLEHSAVDVQVVLTVPVDAIGPDVAASGGGAGGSSRRCSAPGVGDHDLVQVQGARPSEPTFVAAGWLREHLAPVPPVACDPSSGARVDRRDVLAGAGYRPPARLVALVRSRDGRCRFPGCSVAARFCDVDHVRPWPDGPTRAANLVCLCRRHHRIKQSAGWRLRLSPDGVATWTDPSGRVRTTGPLDALDVLVLAAAGPPPPVAAPPDVPTWSALECRVEHLVDHAEALRRAPVHYVRPVGVTLASDTHPHRRPRRGRQHDPPPF